MKKIYYLQATTATTYPQGKGDVVIVWEEHRNVYCDQHQPKTRPKILDVLRCPHCYGGLAYSVERRPLRSSGAN